MIRGILGNIKRWLKINISYPNKYKGSYIASYVPITLTLGEELIIEENISFSSELTKIGKGTYIGCRSVVGNCSEIGMYCSISKDVKIGMSNHPLNLVSTSPRFYLKKYGKVAADIYDHNSIKATTIENDVLISSNVVILEDVRIGQGAVIAASAVVTKNVAPYSIVAGIPAKHIRFRFSEEKIQRLLKIDFNNDQEIVDFK